MGVDVFQMVTDRIIGMLENGEIPWERPWTGAGQYAIKRATGKPYSLLNQMLLGNPGEYLSFKECQKLGGKIKKGAKAKIVVFWKILDCAKTDTNGKPVIGSDGKVKMTQIPFLKYMNVFHIDDCEGIEPRYYENVLRDFNPVDKAEEVIALYVQRSGIGLEHIQQGRAYYNPEADKVVLPIKEQFKGEAEYYSTAFHELTHSTGHQKRLDRITAGSFSFGDETYSKEELVAEIGSASIMNMLGIETDNSVRNNAAYIQSWIKALRNDKKMIVSAASKASKAVELIMPQGLDMDCPSM